jgi:hypothetical protein
MGHRGVDPGGVGEQYGGLRLILVLGVNVKRVVVVVGVLVFMKGFIKACSCGSHHRGRVIRWGVQVRGRPGNRGPVGRGIDGGRNV